MTAEELEKIKGTMLCVEIARENFHKASSWLSAAVDGVPDDDFHGSRVEQLEEFAKTTRIIEQSLIDYRNSLKLELKLAKVKERR